MENPSEKVAGLVIRQLAEWDLARENQEKLEDVRSKSLDFGSYSVIVQFNPGRVRSTTAEPVREKSGPGCFLCPENRPQQQRAVSCGDYDILVNPYPVFKGHLTISHRSHTRQKITGRFGDMIRFAEMLTGHVVFFNGADAGASAPGHMHFQAVMQDDIPAVCDVMRISGESLFRTGGSEIRTMPAYLRQAIVVCGENAGEIQELAEKIIRQSPDGLSDSMDARVNIFAWKDSGCYYLMFFPRTAHRPREYYQTGNDQLLFSPGAIDMAGVVITVRETDYNKITKQTLPGLFAQVTPDEKLWTEFKERLQVCLNENH